MFSFAEEVKSTFNAMRLPVFRPFLCGKWGDEALLRILPNVGSKHISAARNDVEKVQDDIPGGLQRWCALTGMLEPPNARRLLAHKH